MMHSPCEPISNKYCKSLDLTTKSDWQRLRYGAWTDGTDRDQSLVFL